MPNKLLNSTVSDIRKFAIQKLIFLKACNWAPGERKDEDILELVKEYGLHKQRAGEVNL